MCSETPEDEGKSSRSSSSSKNKAVPPLTHEPSSVDDTTTASARATSTMTTTNSNSNTTASAKPSSKRSEPAQIRRRSKRTKQTDVASLRRHNAAARTAVSSSSSSPSQPRSKRRSRAKAKHDADKTSGGVQAILPSLAIMGVLAFAVMARMGFRGRADVAGIDLGTTNSVVCVQSPTTTKDGGGVGKIECIPDPASGSPIVPSVVSFFDHAPGSGGGGGSGRSGSGESFSPNVVVGHEAKLRIDTHPHHTLYHAKRVIGRSFEHDAVSSLTEEVEFNVSPAPREEESDNDRSAAGDNADDSVVFRVPYHSTAADGTSTYKYLNVTPPKVGSYIVDHLISITQQFLGHENVRTAVIAIPAKFDAAQRIATVKAFTDAGVKVARILEEPTAAALAYGLDKKDGVNHIMVFDFGGGTLDVSILHVSDDGYVDVMGSDGDNRLGGADFDAAVAHALLEKDEGDKVVQRLTDSLEAIESRLKKEGIVDAEDDLEELLAEGCPVLEKVPPCTLSSFHTIGEKMKIGLSAYANGGGMVEEVCLGLSAEDQSKPDTVSAFCSALKPVKLTLTSKEYDAAVVDLYRRSMLPIQRILNDLNLKTDEIDEVVMVGGTTRMPKIRDLVRQELGVESLNTHIDPDLTVAYGAASVID
mmetsp:Transcript_26997/g.59989  ORF Transcript_26997/g.59989 Transcript_26997/m.59989 type:complete len:645 (-) Transcript_26997:807-2741(-)